MGFRCTICKGELPEGAIICPSCRPSIPQMLSKEKHEEKSKYVMVDVNEFTQIIQDKDHWHREAIKNAAELGEIKFRIVKLIERNTHHQEDYLCRN